MVVGPMLHRSLLRDIVRRPILAQLLRPVAAGRRPCICTGALTQTWTAGSLSGRLNSTQQRCLSSATSVEDVKQMKAEVASLVAQRHWDDAFDAAVGCSRAIKDLTGYLATSCTPPYLLVLGAVVTFLNPSYQLLLPDRARHPGYASALNNLALIQKNRGEMDAAAVLYKEALEVYKLVYGDVHPSCAMAMHNTCLL